MKNAVSADAKFVYAQRVVNNRLIEKYSKERKVELDKLEEPIIWAKSADDAHMLVKSFMLDDNLKIDFLSDITAYDNIDGHDGVERFVLVYELSSIELHTRIRIKTLLHLDAPAKSLVDIFGGANWLEREVFDLYGIKFTGHPNLRRIMMDERFTGFPLRKEYNIKQREPFRDNIDFNLGENPLQVDTHISEDGK